MLDLFYKKILGDKVKGRLEKWGNGHRCSCGERKPAAASRIRGG